METINNTSFLNYGLHIALYKGLSNLPESKEQFFSVYGKYGYQITKRRENTLELNGFIVATNLADFKAKTTALYTLFSSAGTKVVNLGNGNINCFAKEGFKITNVFILNKVYSKFSINLTIV